MKVTMIPVIVADLGTPSKRLEKIRIAVILTKALLRLAKILKRILENLGNLISLKIL